MDADLDGSPTTSFWLYCRPQARHKFWKFQGIRQDYIEYVGADRRYKIFDFYFAIRVWMVERTDHTSTDALRVFVSIRADCSSC